MWGGCNPTDRSEAEGTSGARSDLVSFNFSFRVGEEVDPTTNK
ncbi:MAG: hypothetical protein ABIE43_03715 [Patescibacteria group bacterium]